MKLFLQANQVEVVMDVVKSDVTQALNVVSLRKTIDSWFIQIDIVSKVIGNMIYTGKNHCYLDDIF